jgi:hypothetical protein
MHQEYYLTDKIKEEQYGTRSHEQRAINIKAYYS